MAPFASTEHLLTPQVVIIGAGPAGLSAGIALSDFGISVLVCEASADPGCKPCGEGLLPAALRELDLLGVDRAGLLAAGSPLRGVRYVSATGQRAEATFAAGSGLGLRRSVLQRLLRARAEQKQSLTLLQADARLVVQDGAPLGVRVEGSVLTPLLVIAADGLNSRARSAAKIPFKRAPPFRYGVRQHLFVPSWTHHVEVYWSDRAEAYVTPVGPNQVNLAILWQAEDSRDGSARRAGVPALASTFPQLAQRLTGAIPADDLRARGPLRVDVPTPARDGLVLLGDAAGYVDAITGEGVGLAVGKARALARTLAPALHSARKQLRLEALAPYLAYAKQLEHRHVMLTHLLLVLRKKPWLLERAIAALSSDPALFAHFLSANQGDVSPLLLPFRSLVGLAQHLMRTPASVQA